MKRFLRSMCIALVIITLFSSFVLAAEENQTRASNFFSKHTTYIDIVGTRQFEVWYNVTALRMMDELGVKSIKIQRSNDGVNWITVRTYDKEDYPDFICEDSFSYSGYVTYSGTPYYYYRAEVCYYAKDNTGIGEYDTYSETIRL